MLRHSCRPGIDARSRSHRVHGTAQRLRRGDWLSRRVRRPCGLSFHRRGARPRCTCSQRARAHAEAELAVDARMHSDASETEQRVSWSHSTRRERACAAPRGAAPRTVSPRPRPRHTRRHRAQAQISATGSVADREGLCLKPRARVHQAHAARSADRVRPGTALVLHPLLRCQRCNGVGVRPPRCALMARFAASEDTFLAHLEAIKHCATALTAFGVKPAPAPRATRPFSPRPDAAIAYAMVRRH